MRNATGELIVFADVDRETIAKYAFNVTVSIGSAAGTKIGQLQATSLGGESKQRARALVRVTVLDINDNSPQFVDPPFVIAVAAGTPANRPIAQLSAVDADEGSNGRVAYRIAENYENLFDINAQGGGDRECRRPSRS